MLKHLFFIVITIITSIILITVSPIHSEDLRTYSKEKELRTKSNSLIVLTVAVKNTSSLRRYLRSSAVAGINVKVLGQGEEWVQIGQKLNLVKSELKQIITEYNSGSTAHDPIVMFTNSYTTLLLGTPAQIISNFKKTKARILFSPEKSCQNPSQGQDTEQHSQVLNCDNQISLNSNGYIGYASSLFHLFSIRELSNEPSDRSYFTKIYQNNDLRTELGIEIDERSTIFQNVHGVRDMIGSCEAQKGIKLNKCHRLTPKLTSAPLPTGILELRTLDDKPTLVNTLYHTQPLVLLGGRGPVARSIVNYFGNYLCGNWRGLTGCDDCYHDTITLSPLKLPSGLLGIFISRPIPFLVRFFETITGIYYPKEKIHILLYNASTYHGNHKAIDAFLGNYTSDYASMKIIQADTKEWNARNMAVNEALKNNLDFYFNIDAEARLKPNVLKLLIEQNRPVISPLLTIPYKTSSNYWGALNQWGNRAKSENHMNIVRREHKGLWSVPCISQAYLVNMNYVKIQEAKLNYTKSNNVIYCTVDDTEFSGEWPFFLTNEIRHGHRVTPDRFETNHVHNELFQLMHNRYDWELSYLHPDWRKSLDMNTPVEQPCPDVFWFPLASTQFCSEIIDTMEKHGKWNTGTNYNGAPSGSADHPNPDPYPTVDVDVIDVGFYPHWVEIVRSYITPLRKRVFTGPILDPPTIETTTVIRYRAEEQSANKPHHDHSTYTVNLALNRPKVDYEGGGCRFIRQNCSVVESRVGWFVMHPGDLTHYHEGMSTTKGTRYILVSFIDPRDIKSPFDSED